jgi:hypothetical protein
VEDPEGAGASLGVVGAEDIAEDEIGGGVSGEPWRREYAVERG